MVVQIMIPIAVNQAFGLYCKNISVATSEIFRLQRLNPKPYINPKLQRYSGSNVFKIFARIINA